MRDSIHPARLARSWRAHLLAVTLLLGVVLAAGCTGSSGSPAAVTAHGAAASASSPASPGPATTSGSAAATGPTTTVPTGPAPSDVVSDCLPPGFCYAPHQYRVAYGIQPLLDRGIDGRGETVTVLSPAPSPNAGPPPSGDEPPAATDIRQDLAAFDSEFGLPAARIQVVTALAGAASPWQATTEEVSDFEILHTVAPAATLRVVLLPSDVLNSAAHATADMLAALRLAVSGTDVASISWSLGEHYLTRAQVAQMHSILLAAAADHVTVDASSGDHGASSDPWWGTPDKEVSLPAADPLVLAVGGTALTASRSTGAYIGEAAMGHGAGSASLPPGPHPGGSGGGFSHLYARPAYQDGVPGIARTRGVPDVAGAGNGSIPIVFTGGGKTYLIALGGTSASAPLWGALVALADQYAHHDLGFVNPAIYRIAGSTSYHKAFHDVTTGNNTVTIGSVTVTGYQAAPGWDPVTGWGSPNAQVLIPLLAA
jgi:subtilase family serine protease